MRDQDLVNALRCISSPGGPKGDCKKCLFCKTEPVPKNLKKTVNLTEWSSCDVDAVGFAAADQIDNMNTHILALQKEIEKLRGQVGEPKDPEKMVAIVEQCAAEHPTKTRQSVFLELFPEAALAKDGVLTICPNTFSPVYKDERGRCKLPYAECDNCRRKFWLADSIPAADVAPVVHGRWISFLDGDHIMPERYYRCSRCGRVESRCQPYCHCGAKMDGGKE